MNKEIEYIGRIETLKMVIFGAALTFILPTLAAIVSITISNSFAAVSFIALLNAFQDKWTIIHLVGSALILLITIYFLGSWTSIEIVIRKKNKFLTGFTAFIVLWTVYFFSYITIEGIQISNRTGQSLASSIFNSCVPVTILLFAVVAIPTSLLFGYLLGKKISNKGDLIKKL